MAEAKTRVVFDLSDTLIWADPDNGYLPAWRPGAPNLLAELVAKGIEPVVWSGADQEEFDFYVSKISGYHELVKISFNHNTAPDLFKMARSSLSSSELTEQERGRRLREGLEVGLKKYPPAIGSRILVDDSKEQRREVAKLGCVAIDPTPTDKDTSSDQWTERVAAAIFATLQD